MRRNLQIILLTLIVLHNTNFNPIFAQCSATSSGNWSDPSTWTNCGGGIPTSTDDVIIDGYTVSIGSGITAEANSLSIENASSTLNSAATSILNVQNTFELKNGPQTVNIYGDINADSISFTGSSHPFTIFNGGSVDITNGVNFKNAVLDINAGGVMNVGGDFDLSGSPSVTVDGGLYVSDNIDFPYDIKINGSGNVGAGTLSCPGYLGDCTSQINANLILPVELYYFKGENLGNRNIIKWATISEKNNDYFLLQKSIDGFQFETIAKITGNGTSYEINKYEYPDVNPAEGNNYYRLKQVDIDGTYHYSDVINIAKKTILGFTTSLYPNPVKQDETIKIKYFGNAPGNVAIQLLDLSGKAIYFKQMFIEKGNNLFEIDLSKVNLQKGMYILNSGNNSFQKVLVE